MRLDLRVDADLPGVAVGAATEAVADLGRYPDWLGFVLAAEPDRRGVGGPEERAWRVELGARVGPLQRAKRLRMVREGDPATGAFAFVRRELDGVDHGTWSLDVTVEAAGDGSAAHLQVVYDGSSPLIRLVEPVLRADAARAPGRLRSSLVGPAAGAADGAGRRG